MGVVYGAIFGLAVLDVDARHGGDETLDSLVTREREFPDSPVALTGGGGSHHYFRLTGTLPTSPSLALCTDWLVGLAKDRGAPPLWCFLRPSPPGSATPR